jgi:predicted transglutaminase-like cysteine proteinase
MLGIFGQRALARVLVIIALAAALCWPQLAMADKTRTSPRSVLDDVLFSANAGSWRTAMLDAGAKAWPSDKHSAVRSFSISGVLKRNAGSSAPANAVAALDFAITSDMPALGLPAASSDEPFGLYQFRAPEGAIWTKWRAIESDMKMEAAEIERCRADSESCSLEVARFLRLSDSARLAGGRKALTIVNEGLNAAIHYQSDMAHHGVIDKWNAPLATLKDGVGDCEDYAIAKYAALREAGLAANDLRILLVRDTISAQDHAVVAARHESHWLILDNRWSGLAEAGTQSRLVPRFALGDDGVHLLASRFALQMPATGEFDSLPASSLTEAGAASLNSAPLPLLM